MENSIKKALKFLAQSQKADGSWDGPLSSRLRETFLVNIVSKMNNWDELSHSSYNWITTEKIDLGETLHEQYLNNALLSLFKNNEKIDLSPKELYHDTLVRKTLCIYVIACMLNVSQINIPKQFISNEIIINYIDTFIKIYDENFKGWATAEILACKIILQKIVGQNSTITKKKLLSLKTHDNNWFSNPATTALSLIALTFKENILPDNKIYLQYFKSIMQEDGGWSYCNIPLWDTGLSLESIGISIERGYNIDFSNSVKNAILYIDSAQNKDGGWGFNQHLESEADTSSIILHSLKYFKTTNLIRSSQDYFKNLQFKNGKFKGLWPVWRKSENPSPEVVAHIASALKSTGSKVNLQTPYKWIEEKIKDGDFVAEWGRNIPYSLFAVANIEHISDETNNVIASYLLKTQNKDGGWGAYPKKESNASATGNAIMALKTIDREKYFESIEKGIKYLIVNQTSNGTWPRVKEVVGPRPFVYADDNSTHNFALQALLI